MVLIETGLPGVVVLEPRVFTDARGYFMETFHSQRYLQYGLPAQFVQQNLSFSTRGVLRGLHYQLGRPQGKLLMVVHGEIFDVAVDIRRNSPTFGQWTGAVLSSDNHRQIYIPEGFAHGFCTTGDEATVLYLCTDYYAPEEERGIRWNDPTMAIPWPVSNPVVSGKDAAHSFLSDVPIEHLPAAA